MGPKGRTLPTIKWQAAREGVCWVGYCKGLLGCGKETHTDIMTLESRHAQGYLVPAGRKSGNVPPGMQQSK